MFKIGEEVVCVDDTPPDMCSLEGLKAGEIYHIRWLGYMEDKIGRNMLSNYEPDVFFVRLYEIHRELWNGEEPPYYSWRFDSLKKKSTNIEIFKQLTRPKKKVLEDA